MDLSLDSCTGIPEEEDFRQILVLRKDLHMRTGKMVAQGAHASQLAIEATRSVAEDWYRYWRESGMTKICVYVTSLEALFTISKKASEANIPYALVEDEGRTEFHGFLTITAVGIGPAPRKLLEPITGGYPLL